MSSLIAQLIWQCISVADCLNLIQLISKLSGYIFSFYAGYSWNHDLKAPLKLSIMISIFEKAFWNNN